MEQIPTSAYHPHANGQVESRNGDIWTRLEKHGKDSDWDLDLPSVVMAINVQPSRRIGVSPYELVFGKAPPSSSGSPMEMCDWVASPT